MSAIQNKLIKWLASLEGYVSKFWFPPLLGVLAAADAFLVFIPTDGILVSSTMATPKRWFWLAFCGALGSSLGAFALFILSRHYGLPWIDVHFSEFIHSKNWIEFNHLIDHWGWLFVLAYSATPFPQQPVVLIAGLSEIHLIPFCLATFVGRLVKFLVVAYAGARAPWLLKRLWGIKDDLKKVDLNNLE
jgi:membrane protein YqaA with SNARE-associated domain